MLNIMMTAQHYVRAAGVAESQIAIRADILIQVYILHWR